MKENPIINSFEIKKTALILQKGGVAVFPTDTLYAIGANINHIKAIKRIFKIKNRPKNLGLPILIESINQLTEVGTNISKLAFRLAKIFWPGPLTLIVPKNNQISSLITGGATTTAVRIPNNKDCLSIIKKTGAPITGTSANPTGEKDVIDPDIIHNWFDSKVDYIFDKKPSSSKGIDSTILDVTKEKAILLREGDLKKDFIEKNAGITIS